MMNVEKQAITGLLQNWLPAGVVIDDYALAGAFADLCQFKADNKYGEDVALGHKRILGRELTISEKDFLHLMLTVHDYQVNDYLRYVIPGFVADPDRVIKCFAGKHKHEQMKQIISAKRCMELPGYVHEPGKYPLMDAIHYHPLKYESFKVLKKTESAVKKLQEMRTGYQSRLWLATEVYCAGKVKGAPQRDKPAYQAILEVDAMDLLGGLTGRYTSTNVPIELGLLYEKMAMLAKPRALKENLALVNVSPFLMKRVIGDKVLKDVHITIVVFRQESKNLLLHSKRLMTRINKEKASVICIDELGEKSKQMPITQMVIGMEKAVSDKNLEAFFRRVSPIMVMDSRIIILQSSDFIDQTSRHFQLDAGSVCRLDEVHLLPQGIPNTKKPKRRTLAIYHVTESNQKNATDPKYHRYRLVQLSVLERDNRREERYVLSCESHQDVSEAIAKQYGNLPMRQAYDRANQLVKPKRQEERRSAKTYFLAPELPIDYILGDKSIVAYFTHPKRIKGVEIIGTSGKKIASTYQRVRRTDMVSQGDLFVKTVYPHSQIAAAKTPTSAGQAQQAGSVRTTAAKERLLYLKGRPISLRALWYLYDSEGLFVAKDLTLIKMILEAELGLITPGETSGDEMAQRIHTYCLKTGRSTSSIVKILEKLIDIAVNQKHAQINALRDTEVQSVLKQRDRKREATSFLPIRSLTDKQQRKLYELLQQEFHQDIRAVGAALRFYTGLSSNIICALRQFSVKPIDGYEGYYIDVLRQLTNDGKDIKLFAKANMRLCFPFPPMLEDIMKANSRRLEQTNIPRGKMGKIPFLFKLTESPLNNEVQAISPKELESYCRSMLEKLKLPKRTIETVLPDKGTVELSNERGIPNFPLSHFRHYANHVAQMELGDLAYLTATKGPDTLSVHYIGYRSMGMLYNMRAVLERWYARFTRKPGIKKMREQGTLDSTPTVIVNQQDGRHQPKTNLKVCVPKGTVIEIRIKAEHGARIQSM